MPVCETCLEIWTEEGADRETAEELAHTMGLDAQDHRCEELDGGSPCDCICHNQLIVKEQS